MADWTKGTFDTKEFTTTGFTGMWGMTITASPPPDYEDGRTVGRSLTPPKVETYPIEPPEEQI